MTVFVSIYCTRRLSSLLFSALHGVTHPTHPVLSFLSPVLPQLCPPSLLCTEGTMRSSPYTLPRFTYTSFMSFLLVSLSIPRSPHLPSLFYSLHSPSLPSFFYSSDLSSSVLLYSSLFHSSSVPLVPPPLPVQACDTSIMQLRWGFCYHPFSFSCFRTHGVLVKFLVTEYFWGTWVKNSCRGNKYKWGYPCRRALFIRHDGAAGCCQKIGLIVLFAISRRGVVIGSKCFVLFICFQYKKSGSEFSSYFAIDKNRSYIEWKCGVNDTSWICNFIYRTNRHGVYKQSSDVVLNKV